MKTFASITKGQAILAARLLEDSLEVVKRLSSIDLQLWNPEKDDKFQDLYDEDEDGTFVNSFPQITISVGYNEFQSVYVLGISNGSVRYFNPYDWEISKCELPKIDLQERLKLVSEL
jgi:hypothetical protein